TVDSEHLLEDLTDGAQRVELTALDLVEQPPELRVVRDRPLEVLLRARRGDREHLARQVPPPTLVELSRLLEVGTMRLDLPPQLRDVLAARRLGQHDRRSPLALGVEREDRSHLVQH